LIDDLWGDDLPGNPAGTLSAKVSQLRRAFEDAEPGSRALVVSGPAGYSLKVDTDSYDVLRFAACHEEGRVAEALQLWRGPAYADFADEAFVETAVARLNEQRLTAYETHFEQRLAAGDYAVSELGELGFAARRTGALDEAEVRLQALVDAARRQDQPVLYLSIVLEELGYTYELGGAYDKARALHAEAFRVSQEYRSGRSMCWALEGLAAALVDAPELAACLLGAAAAVREAESYAVSAAEAADLERAAARVVGYEASYARGKELGLEEAFALVPESPR
jgi:hypothetical protein